MDTFAFFLAAFWGWSQPTHGVIEFARPLTIESERIAPESINRMFGYNLSQFVSKGMTEKEIEFILGKGMWWLESGDTHGFWRYSTYCHNGVSISFKLDDGIWRVTNTKWNSRDPRFGCMIYWFPGEPITNVGPFRFATPISSVPLEKN